MQELNANRLGVALGTTGALFYLACIVIMAVLPPDASVKFFNTMMHGTDLTTIARFDIPWWESMLGIVLYFVWGWITGVLVAAIYNFGGKSRGARRERAA